MFAFFHIFPLLWELAFWELHILGIVWVNRKNRSKFLSGKDVGIPIYFLWCGKQFPDFFQKPTALERYGFPQNTSVLWEFAHSQT